MELAWKNRLNLKIDQSKFSKINLESIKNLRDVDGKSWIEIAAIFSNGNKRKTPLQCLGAYQKMKFSEKILHPHSKIEKLKLSKIQSSENNSKHELADFFHGRFHPDFYRRRITWGSKNQISISEKVNALFTDKEDADLLTILLSDDSLDIMKPGAALKNMTSDSRTEMELLYRLMTLKMLIDGNVGHWRVLSKLFEDCSKLGFWSSSIIQNFPSISFENSITRNIIV